MLEREKEWFKALSIFHRCHGFFLPKCYLFINPQIF